MSSFLTKVECQGGVGQKAKDVLGIRNTEVLF